MQIVDQLYVNQREVPTKIGYSYVSSPQKK